MENQNSPNIEVFVVSVVLKWNVVEGPADIFIAYRLLIFLF